MIYWELFLGFLKVGCLSFGGAYGAIPLIQDVVLSYGWMSEEQLTYMIAVSESTPGPIMVNLATFVGNTQGGFWGAVLATATVVLPAFVIMILVSLAMKKFMENRGVKLALRGLKPCVIGLILATGIYMMVSHCVGFSGGLSLDLKALILTALLAGIRFLSQKLRKKKISSIQLILIAAVLGMGLYAL